MAIVSDRTNRFLKGEPLKTALRLTLGLMLVSQAHAEPAGITVRVNEPGHKIAPTWWVIFSEDINLSADGGIYPEQVRNRNFEDSDQPDHWTGVSRGMAEVELSIDREKPISPKDPRSLKVVIAEAGNGVFGKWHNGEDPDTPEYRAAFAEVWKSAPTRKPRTGLGANERGFDEAWVYYGGADLLAALPRTQE